MKKKTTHFTSYPPLLRHGGVGAISIQCIE